MTTHLSLNKKYQIATWILEGESFASVAGRYNISKAGAAKIFHKMKFRIFCMLHERVELGLDMNDINSLRDGWAKIKGL